MKNYKKILSIILVIFIILASAGVIVYLKNKNVDSVNNNEIILRENSTNEINSLYETEEKEKYTSNLTDSQNGKTAFIKLESEGDLKTEKHDDYYTYVDPFNNNYNIREIKNVVSENGVMGKDNWAALFKVTVTYLDNYNKIQTMELAIVLLPNYEIQNKGTYINYTGSTDFVKSFTNLYEIEDKEESKDESNDFIKLTGTYSYEEKSKDVYYFSKLIILNQTTDSIEFSIDAVHGRDIEHVNIGEVNGIATKVQVPDKLVDNNALQCAYQFVDKIEEGTNKITLVYTNHRGIEYVSIIEDYVNGINPYGGAGVYFAADYERE